jgi:predicted  nucleic acid-binding Zn-ribbon protein
MTNKNLELLVELSFIDKAIEHFEPRIKEITKNLDLILDEKELLVQKEASLQESQKNSNLKISKNSTHLAELKIRLEDIAKKSSMVKKEKEAKALTLEEEITKEQITFANEEIDRLEKNIAQEEDELKEISKTIAKLDKDAKNKEAELKDDMVSIEKERETVYKNKDEIIDKIEQKMFTFYNKIKNWAGNSAVVPVKRQACYGCHIKLNEITFKDFQTADSITTCPYCGRILYQENDEEK